MSFNTPTASLDVLPSGSSPSSCSASGAVSADPSSLPDLLRLFRHRIDEVRAEGSSHRVQPSEPADLALSVVAEALAIGEAMSRLSATNISNSRAEADCRHIPATYAQIDSRFLEHRARALRSALHSIDDYVWWGGMAASAR